MTKRVVLMWCASIGIALSDRHAGAQTPAPAVEPAAAGAAPTPAAPPPSGQVSQTPPTVTAAPPRTSAVTEPAAAPTQTIVVVPFRQGGELPLHLSAGTQNFRANVTGLRSYLESMKTTNPRLYSQLSPDLDNLEERTGEARFVLAAGLGLTAVLLALSVRAIAKSCGDPSAFDANFAAESSASYDCNRSKGEQMGAFAGLSVLTLLAGSIGFMALTPSRADIFDLVNKHNRLSPEPLRVELGYDPTSRLSFAGLHLTY